MEYPHRPVLVDEVARDLVSKADGVYVDGTAGTGGHSETIAVRLSSGGRLICLDRDPEAVRICTERMAAMGDRTLGVRISLIQSNYADLDGVLQGMGIAKVDGILLDLGMSTLQLEQEGRGFSFYRDEPLDMRMDPAEGVPASHLVNTLTTEALARLLKEYGEERRAKAIARRITRERSRQPIERAAQLAKLIAAVVPRSGGRAAKHPATRTFQALRIAVNRELEHLKTFLQKAPSLMATGGRLVILSYHSLEDRIVKQTMRDWEQGCQCPPDLPCCACGKRPLFRRVHKKGLKPGPQEIRENPRARSAILRAAERI